MKISLRRPGFTGRKTIISLVSLATLTVSAAVFEIDVRNAEAGLIPDNLAVVIPDGQLAFLSDNTLLPISDPAGPEPRVAKKIPVLITAYSSTPEETDDTPFITAAGTWVRDGIIANNLLPFGTKVRIPEVYGDKIFVVEDRMNSRKSVYHFDVWFSSNQEAKNFGVKRTNIEILEN